MGVFSWIVVSLAAVEVQRRSVVVDIEAGVPRVLSVSMHYSFETLDIEARVEECK